MIKGILFADGTPFIEELINPIYGYRGVHMTTGRILPTCQRFEIYSWNAIVEKFIELKEMGINISDYELEIVYENEVEDIGGWIPKFHPKDFH